MKIICIGRNYMEHASELRNPVPEEPIFFLKPETAILRKNRPFHYPAFSREIHHEVEIIVKISQPGKNIDVKQAPSYYEQIGIGIDFTARDLQQKAKEKGLPWTQAKGFDHAAPISPFLTKTTFPDLQDIRFHLMRNGNVVQTGCTRDMIFPIDELISYLSKFMTLKSGDMIFTGTPAGVGPVEVGDRLEAFIEGKKLLHCKIQ